MSVPIGFYQIRETPKPRALGGRLDSRDFALRREVHALSLTLQHSPGLVIEGKLRQRGGAYF